MYNAGLNVQRIQAFLLCIIAGTGILGGGCQPNVNQNPPASRLRDINAVLADHAKELMAIPGVVGVYVGLLPDDRTPCLKVMLSRMQPEQTKLLPKKLEGYPVVTEVTGEIRPLNR